MSDDSEQADAGQASAADDQTCLPCRGTGQVISGLGGTPRPVACPWCEGSGQRRAGIDAQAHWREQPPEDVASGGDPRGAADAQDG